MESIVLQNSYVAIAFELNVTFKYNVQILFHLLTGLKEFLKKKLKRIESNHCISFSWRDHY